MNPNMEPSSVLSVTFSPDSRSFFIASSYFLLDSCCFFFSTRTSIDQIQKLLDQPAVVRRKSHAALPQLPAVATRTLKLRVIENYRVAAILADEPRCCGRLCLYRKKINLGTSLAGQAVGVKEVDHGIWLVSFMDYDLGYIDLEEKTLQPLENPFGPKV